MQPNFYKCQQWIALIILCICCPELFSIEFLLFFLKGLRNCSFWHIFQFLKKKSKKSSKFFAKFSINSEYLIFNIFLYLKRRWKDENPYFWKSWKKLFFEYLLKIFLKKKIQIFTVCLRQCWRNPTFYFLGRMGWDKIDFTSLSEMSPTFHLSLWYEPRNCFGKTKVSLTWKKKCFLWKTKNDKNICSWNLKRAKKSHFWAIVFFCPWFGKIFEGNYFLSFFLNFISSALDLNI